MISICIPTYNRLPYLKKCLDSIFNGFKEYPYEIIIADGGSTDGTLEYLRGLDKVKLIEQGELTGAVKACNVCFKAAKGDYLALVTDDFVIFPDIMIKACKCMDQEKQIGLVGPKMQETKYGNLHNILLWDKPYWILSPKVFIFRAEVLKEIGYFDEHFRTYYIDADVPLMVLKFGYTIAVTRDVGIIHLRIHDHDINEAKAANCNPNEQRKAAEYMKKKWMPLQMCVEEYLRHQSLKKRKSLFFKRFCGMMYCAEWLRPFVEKNNKLAMKLYDWFLEQTVIFKDTNYNHSKDLFLAQKYPAEIISCFKEQKPSGEL
jgi:GT2 family glycosyltransferase